MFLVHVCVCVFSSHSFWTSSLLDVPAGVTHEEGHAGCFIHLSAVHALIFLARRIQPRTDSPLSWFPDKSSAFKALNPPSVDRSAPANALIDQPMLYDDDFYNHDKHNYIWHEGLAIFMYEIAALKSKDGPYRQTDHNTKLFTTSDLLKNDRLMLPSAKYRLFRTRYGQASTKTQKRRTDSPLSSLNLKLSVSRALNPPSADRSAPANATETFNENHQARHDYIMNKSLKKIR